MFCETALSEDPPGCRGNVPDHGSEVPESNPWRYYVGAGGADLQQGGTPVAGSLEGGAARCCGCERCAQLSNVGGIPALNRNEMLNQRFSTAHEARQSGLFFSVQEASVQRNKMPQFVQQNKEQSARLQEVLEHSGALQQREVAQIDEPSVYLPEV